jgi:hypothetical protein
MLDGLIIKVAYGLMQLSVRKLANGLSRRLLVEKIQTRGGSYSHGF